MSQMPDPAKTAELLAEHYQKTYEVTYELWKARNRLFPTLAAVIGAAIVLAFHDPKANSLLAAVIGSILRLDDATRQALQQGFTYQILQTVLMVVVFHLLLDLYRHNQDITRSYKYLAEIEAELQRAMGLPSTQVAFTRESTFYQKNKIGLVGGVRAVYAVVLGVLLALFLYFRINDDFVGGDLRFILVDIAIAIPIVLYFLDYVFPGIFNRKKA